MSKDRVASTLKTAGRGFLTGASYILDATTNVRIAEIDEEMKKLQEERDRLSGQLINKPKP